MTIVGIIGGGQLARMLHEAATPLGLDVRLFAEGPETSAAQVVPGTTVGDYTDAAELDAFAAGCDVVTFDHEHVPTALLENLERRGIAVRPGPSALVHAQDKAVMRERLTALGVPCPAWRVVASPAELAEFASEHGWPVIAKTSRGGYDGKGVWKVGSPEEASEPFEAITHGLGPGGRLGAEAEAEDEASGAGGAASAAEGQGGGVPRPVILAEEFVPFVRELSVLVARRPGGETAVYPVSQTGQCDGICHETTTPAPGMDAGRASGLQAMAIEIADALGVVGLLAVELMEHPDGRVVVNELAMRPHNTGHWSIEGAVTSQFENHLRAVADLPLGPTDLRAPVVVMSNVLGGDRHDLLGEPAVVWREYPAVQVHHYGQGEPLARKVGHVTTFGDDVATVQGAARAASDYLEGIR